MINNLRITSGFLLNRSFRIPEEVKLGLVRPTTDMVKESIFSSLKYKIKDAIILDLFSGSGSHAFESISRGAQYVHMVEYSYNVVLCIKYNIDMLNVQDYCNIYLSDYIKFIIQNKKYIYDIVFVDPPYNMILSKNFWQKLLKFLIVDSVVIYRYFYKCLFNIPDAYVLIQKKQYGSMCVVFLMPSKIY